MAEEEKYEYEDEYGEQVEGEEEVYEEYIPSETPWWMRKAVPVLISLGFHGLLAWIAAYMLFAIIPPKTEAAILTKREFVEPEYDETLKRGTIRTPRIDAEIMVEHPIIILEEEQEITKSVPRGTSFENLSNKNLDSTQCVDAYGLGGGRAGAYGARWGKGCLPREGGSPGTESAVFAALRWLHFHQDKNGQWDQDGLTRTATRGKDPGAITRIS